MCLNFQNPQAHTFNYELYIYVFTIAIILFIKFFRKYMENQFKQLCSCLLELSKIDEIIQTNKLSYVEVKAMMDLIDVKRRGFLDLNGIFELVGKVTEKELFDIFKWLDRNRTGEIRTQELQMALGNSDLTTRNTNKQYIFPRFYKMIDTVKDKPKSVVQIKQKYPFDSSSLKGIYQYICGLIQSKYLSQQELITVFKSQFIKNNLKWSTSCENILRELFPSQNISQTKFIDSFSCKINNTDEEEECLLKGISDNTFVKNQTIYVKHKLNQFSSNIPQNKQKSPSFSRKMNNFLDSSEFRNPSKEEKLHRSPSSNQNSHYKTNFDQIENSISSVLQNIQQRRDKLRQDSLQRKKLIDDVMQRKKQLYVSNDWSQNASEWNFEKDQNHRNSSTTTNVKKVAKSYLNYHPTFYQNTPQNPILREEKPLYKKFQFENAGNEGSSVSYERPCGHLKSSASPTFSPYEPQKRPSTPTASSEISQILKKYSPNLAVESIHDDSDSTLKSLCKSKSGFIYQNTLNNQTRQTSKYYQEKQHYEHYGLSRGGMSSSASKLRDNSYKENVMKRAQQEAAKKIQEIQRKARMKVLEKKGGFRNRQEIEWNKISKHNF